MENIVNNKDWRCDYTKQIDYSIGHGSFGKVYIVRSNSNHKYYAMKKIDLNQPVLKTSSINKSYALEEGIKINKLNVNHPNVIKYYSCYQFNHKLYWIMEYCDGGNLKDKLNLYIEQNKKCLPEGLIWHFAIQILNGINYIHSKGIIHRDLKPENILIQNKNGVCKLADFSFAKIINNLEVSYEDDEEGFQIITDNHFNISQVGTPSYMPPELRSLIEAQHDFSSLDTFNQKLKTCQKNLFKGDIFSFGCILFELTFLKQAFENKFHLDEDEFNRIDEKIDKEEVNFSELKMLIKKCLHRDPEKRMNIDQLFKTDPIKAKYSQNFESFYFEQIIPGIQLDSSKINSFTYYKETLKDSLKPVAMKCLKFKNLILVLANFELNINESFLLIFNEFCQFVKEIKFNFKSFDFCLDERYSQFYISNQKGEIIRYTINFENHFDLQLDGILDLKDEIEHTFVPHHLIIIEHEFNENNTRKLIFNDIKSNQLICLKVNLKMKTIGGLIKCNLNRGITLDNVLKQILYTNQDLICLFDSSDKINIYDLKTFQYKGCNINDSAKLNSYKSITCICMDSSFSIYSSDGKSIFKLENETFKKCKKITPSLKSSDNKKSLSHSINWISLMANGSLVLLTDSIQMESASLFVLKQVLKE